MHQPGLSSGNWWYSSKADLGGEHLRESRGKKEGKMALHHPDRKNGGNLQKRAPEFLLTWGNYEKEKNTAKLKKPLLGRTRPHTPQGKKHGTPSQKFSLLKGEPIVA